MDGKWLKTQFDLYPDKSRADLAKFLSVDPPAVSKILSGKRQIKAHEYLAMREFFGLGDGNEAGSLLSADRHYALRPLSKPSSGLEDQAGFSTAADESDQWVIPAKILRQRTQAPPEKIKIFAVEGHAMAPDFNASEHVLVDMTDKQPSPPGIFLLSDGLSFLIRQCEIIPHSRPLSVRVQARSSQYSSYDVPLDDIEITGRVIAKLEWV